MKGGWQVTTIGDAFRVVSGGTPKTGVAAYWGGPHRWITPAEMGGLPEPYLSESRRTLTDEGLRLGAELVPPGSVILSTRAPIGHLVINEVPMAFNQGCRGLVPNAGISTKFAYYFLLANVPLLDSLGTGATFKELSASKLKQVPFRYPGEEEQERIVEVLDKTFEAVATALANVKQGLLRAEELAQALEEQCFDRHVDEAFAPKQLATVCELIVDCEHKTAPTQDDGFPSIRTPNIGRGKLILDGVNRVAEEVYRAWTRRAVPLPGDLILAREAPAGNIAVIPEGQMVCLGQRTVLIRPKADIFVPEYLAHLLLQRKSQQRLLAHSRGATVAHINMKDIRAFPISGVPSLAIQRQVVDALEEVEAHRAALVRCQTQKLAAFEELKRSTLQRALSGDL